MKIEAANVDKSKRPERSMGSRRVKILVSLAGRVVGLATIQGRLYWSDADKYEIRSVSISENRVEKSKNNGNSMNDNQNEGRFETSLDRISVAGMVTIEQNSAKSAKVKSKNPCAVDNGKCEGICLLGDGAYTRD